MNIVISNNDQYEAYRKALSLIAHYHEIENFEFKTNRVIYDEIVAINSPLLEPLTNYVIAYDEWFSFVLHVGKAQNEAGTEQHLTAKGEYAIAELQAKRQETLAALQAAYDELKKPR